MYFKNNYTKTLWKYSCPEGLKKHEYGTSLGYRKNADGQKLGYGKECSFFS
jgi:hypothetical protein